MTRTAEFNSRCPSCDDPIYEGDEIKQVEGEWLHIECADEENVHNYDRDEP